MSIRIESHPTASGEANLRGCNSAALTAPSERRGGVKITRYWERLRKEAPVFYLPKGKILVVAPHPDDEVLSTGGLIFKHTSNKQFVDVLSVTSGENAYPDNVSKAELLKTRSSEQQAALKVLGGELATLIELRIPDGSVKTHQDYLTKRIAEVAADYSLIVAPWSNDYHTDHIACALAAAAAAAQTGTPVLGSIFWGWHYSDLSSLADVGLVGLPLEPQAVKIKAEALHCHNSQLNPPSGYPPILFESDLEPMSLSCEYYVPYVK